MADNRDVLAQMLAAGQTGGLTPGDFTTFANKLNDPTALQAWHDAGGIFAQSGGQVPDPDEQYFAMRPAVSGSGDDMGWMNTVQPWQQGAAGYQSQQQTMPGWIGGGSMMRADPAYWGWQGPHQGYAPGSVGDMSGFNAGRGGGAGGTGGLTPSDFATFSRLVSPQALQEWLNAGGVQGQFGGGMGGAVGGGGGGGGGGGVGHGSNGPSPGPGPGPGPGPSGWGQAADNALSQAAQSGLASGLSGLATGPVAGGLSPGPYGGGYNGWGFGPGDFGSQGPANAGSIGPNQGQGDSTSSGFGMY